MKAISKACGGMSIKEIRTNLMQVGDLGIVAQSNKSKQQSMDKFFAKVADKNKSNCLSVMNVLL